MSSFEINWLLVASPYRLSTSSVETLYLSTKGFTSKPTDTPANQPFLAVVEDPGNFQLHAFRDGRTFGQSESSFGDAILNNEGGSLDHLIYDYAWDGRPFQIYRLEMRPNATFAQAVLWFTGTVEQAEGSWTKVTLRLRDRQDELDIELEEDLFAGTNSGATGVEGLPGDIANQPKPNLYGKCVQVEAVPVNTTTYIYQVNNGSVQSISNVRVAGATMTFDADYANVANLNAATITGDEYATCKALGLMRFASLPAGVVTCDCEGHNDGGYVSTVADIIERIVTTKGPLSTGDLNSTSFDDLNTANSEVVGVYIKAGARIRDVIDQLCANVGAFWFFDSEGLLTVKQLTDPTAETPVLTITKHHLFESNAAALDRVVSSDVGAGIPNWQVVMTYQPCWYEFADGDIVGSVSAEERSYLVNERRVTDDEGAVKLKWLTSVPLRLFSAFDQETAAQTECTRRLNLYKTLHARYRASIPTRYMVGRQLGDFIKIDVDRWDLSGGKVGVLLSKVDELAFDLTTIEVWI